MQAYYQQNKGTLAPGQTISVNKYTVQVERYLSQGGFAHVYLVRTATPVYNTTHHVLKRIAVANEAMLTDVKKEVDIMRLLKGHPNIVHLIDAAWHRMSKGLYEVFILMEFCPGGGIIDMMNRRLRERLTEAEILQIFVDVCEGVAYMHNSRPPLLHRDLKVENILQASPTSFKLCDFGSATTVATRLPQTSQEFRALEDDLNRHTTLQYRAPEMIDVHLRRPVDEKSDVWALGVLLYKLCYYTTPFEEHGPLAILNVQYKTPPYPTYSPNMGELIGMMLREHGSQRPTVFEILNHVHRLRGTKSQFTYTIPVPKPLSPNVQTQFKSPSPSNVIGSTISYRHGSSIVPNVPKPASSGPSPPTNAGVQARDKVLEAIAPMRRGRPTASKESSTSRPPSPDKGKNWLEDEDKAWEAVSKKATQAEKTVNLDDAFSVSSGGQSDIKKTGQGFGDDFGAQLWNESDPNAQSSKRFPAASSVKSTITRVSSLSRPRAIPTAPKEKDAFDSLGIRASEVKPALTLAEARKLRTGLAAPTSPPSLEKYGSNPLSSTAPSSIGQSLVPPPLKPSGSGSSWSSQPPSRPSSSHQRNNSAEVRFPSLEELDASFTPSNSSVKIPPHVPSQPQLASPPSSIYTSDTNKPASVTQPSRPPLSTHGSSYTSYKVEATPSPAMNTPSSTSATSANTGIRRSSIIRKHRSSVTMKQNSPSEGLPSSSYFKSSSKETSAPVAVTPKKAPTTDWLTGDDSDTPSTSARMPSSEPIVAVVRNSPSKRASVIERSNIPIPQAHTATREQMPPSSQTLSRPLPPNDSLMSDSPSARAHRIFPDLDTTTEPSQSLIDNWSPVTSIPTTERQRKATMDDSTSSADEGPEDADRYVPTAKSASKISRPQRKGRQSSVHDLVDLYGGGKDKPFDMPRPSNTPQLPPRPTGSDSVPDKRRSLTATPLSITSRRKSTSPQPIALSYSERPSSQTPRTPTAASPTSASSSRSSRPQSMFVFPSSKSTDSSAPLLAGLSPPPDTEPKRSGRRTSISDMVQRFEAIDAVARTSAVTTIPASKIVKSETLAPTSASPVKRPAQSNGRMSASLSAPEQKPRVASGSMHRTSPTGLGRISPSPLPEPSKPNVDAVTPRPRRMSTKDGSVPFPSQKSPADDSPTDTRSPSPERPYQGVGKLIDQWQRKTAETEAATKSIVPKRGGFVAKRAGLVNGPNASR